MKLAIHHFESVNSTNDSALHYVHEGSGEGLVILADTQTNGRGRHGRVWSSLPGNLYTSLVLIPSLHEQSPDMSCYGQLAYVAGLGVARALTALGCPNVHLKWPNDGHVNYAKLFGVLIECIDDVVIVGIGVNIDHAPDHVGQDTTCLHTLMTDKLSRDDVFHAVLKDVFKTYREWLADGLIGIKQDYLAYAAELGTEVTINGKIGVFDGLSDDGAFMLRTDDGVVHAITTRDV